MSRFADHPQDEIPAAAQAELEEFRAALDKYDAQIVELLAKRFEVVDQIRALKDQHGLNAVQPRRAQAVIDKAAALGAEHGLSSDFVRRIYDAIIDHAHAVQESDQ